MANVGDVLRVRGCQALLGETLCNVFYYLVTIWTGNLDLDDFLDEFTASVVSIIQGRQTTDIEWTDLNIDNLMDEDEFIERPVSLAGQSEDNVMPAYVAVGVQLVRTTKQTRHGAKRFAGFGEGHWTDGEFTMIADVKDDIEDACEAEIDIDPGGGNQILAVPCIVSTGIDGKLNPNVTNLVKQAVVRRDTTQNSRKGYTR